MVCGVGRIVKSDKTCNSFYIRLICDYLENAYESAVDFSLGAKFILVLERRPIIC